MGKNQAEIREAIESQNTPAGAQHLNTAPASMGVDASMFAKMQEEMAMMKKQREDDEARHQAEIKALKTQVVAYQQKNPEMAAMASIPAATREALEKLYTTGHDWDVLRTSVPDVAFTLMPGTSGRPKIIGLELAIPGFRADKIAPDKLVALVSTITENPKPDITRAIDVARAFNASHGHSLSVKKGVAQSSDIIEL